MTAIVGPLPTIRFQDGTRMAYTPPRNTVDNRAYACTEHHPACDCREAHMAEDRTEIRIEREMTEAAFAKFLDGHTTRSFTDDTAVCMCTGCQIARECYMPYWRWQR